MISLTIICDGCHARRDVASAYVHESAYGCFVLRQKAKALGWATSVARPLRPRGHGTRDYCPACATRGQCSEEAEP